MACQTHQTVALSCFFMGITLTQSFLLVPTCLSPCSKRSVFCLTPDSPTIPSSFSSKPHSLTHRFPYWTLRWIPRCGTPKALYSQTFHSYPITKPFLSYPRQQAGWRTTVWFWSFGKLFSVCRWVYAFWNVCKLHCKPVIWDRNGSVSVECMNEWWWPLKFLFWLIFFECLSVLCLMLIGFVFHSAANCQPLTLTLLTVVSLIARAQNLSLRFLASGFHLWRIRF